MTFCLGVRFRFMPGQSIDVMLSARRIARLAKVSETNPPDNPGLVAVKLPTVTAAPEPEPVAAPSPTPAEPDTEPAPAPVAPKPSPSWRRRSRPGQPEG
jgi:hypothetical protein